MAVFKKKTTLVHHITYMGIMTTINLIFILLATYFPVLMFIPVIFLPFASALVSYECKKRYYIIYAVASIGLCLLVSFNITDTIFYVVPAVVTGFFIGVLLEKKINPFWMVLISTIIEASLTFAFIPLINLISNIDIVETFISAFKLSEFPYKTDLTYLFVFFLALVQCALSHFVLLSEIKRMGIEINIGVECFSPYVIGLEIAVLLSIVFSFFYTPLAFVLLAISFYFGAFLLIDIVTSKKVIVYVIAVVLFIAAFFGFAILYRFVSAPHGLLIMLLFPISMAITSFVNICLKRKA